MMRFLLVLLPALLLAACKPDIAPKPKAYPRVFLPEKAYTEYRAADCPYQFDLPVYAEIERDSFFFEDSIVNQCWINILMPDLNGTIHLSYKEIGRDITLAEAQEDAHKMTYHHSKRADYIDESNIKNKNGVEGLLYEVGGDAASAVQFYLTDYEKHYVRGALYFKAEANADSLAPVVAFVKQDVFRLFETWDWQTEE